MTLQFTALVASILGLHFFYLSTLVIKARQKSAVSLGDGGIDDLQKATRAHANFSEYVPLCLVLYAVAEINTAATWLLVVAGVLLVYGRIVHAFGLAKHTGVSWQRISGTLATFVVLIGLSLFNIVTLALHHFL